MFSYESKPNDPKKKFAFDKSVLPKEPRPINASNRATYGYANPKQTSATGIAVIGGSTVKINDPNSPTVYEYTLSLEM